LENHISERRSFLKTSTGVAAAASILRPETVRGTQANSALTIGLVGCGGRGTYVSGLFAKNEYAKFTGICDIYEDRLDVAQKQFSGAKRYKAIQEILASDIDAVYIATPAVLHPEHFELAVKARKHIFMEKPVGVDAKGCLRVMRAAKQADPAKRISVDFQQRYGKDYRKAHELVKSGALGQIKMVRAAWLGGGPPVRKGHAAAEEKIRNWFFYRDMSGDIIIEQDCHNIDVVNWFVGNHPVKCSGYGSRQIRRDIGDILDNLSVSFQFADGLVFSYSANQFGGPVGYSDVSETFICENGTVTTSRRGFTVFRPGKAPETTETKYDITLDAVNEFVDGARTGKIENFAPAAAESTLTAVMAKDAIYGGRELTWDRVLKS